MLFVLLIFVTLTASAPVQLTKITFSGTGSVLSFAPATTFYVAFTLREQPVIKIDSYELSSATGQAYVECDSVPQAIISSCATRHQGATRFVVHLSDPNGDPSTYTFVFHKARASGVVVGTSFSCAYRDRSVACWGLNANGRLGRDDSVSPIGDPFELVKPVILSGMTTPALLAAYEDAVCLVSVNFGGGNSAFCWGSNAPLERLTRSTNDPNMGDATNDLRNANPVYFLDYATVAIIQLVMLARVSCGLFSTGTVRCWGDGLGLGSNGVIAIASYDAVNIPFPGSERAVFISGSEQSPCAIFISGTVRCWGAGTDGQLGIDTNQDWGGSPSFPMSLLPAVKFNPTIMAFNVPLATAGGSFHNCALFSNGRILCWGKSTSGQLGTENGQCVGLVPALCSSSVSSAGFVSFSDNQRKIVRVVAAMSQTCVMFESGGPICFGANTGSIGLVNGLPNGVLGALQVSSMNPIPIVGAVTDNLHSMGTWSTHSCVMRASGSVTCFGSNTNNALGLPSATSDAGFGGASDFASIPNVPLGSVRGFSACDTSRWAIIFIESNLGGGDVSCLTVSIALTADASTSSFRILTFRAIDPAATLFVDDAPYETSVVALSSFVMNYIKITVVSQGVAKLSLRIFVRRKRDAEVHTGLFNTCVLSALGKVSCFGGNAWGQLGNDSPLLTWIGDDPSRPIAAPITFTPSLNTVPIYSISFTFAHVCAFWNTSGGKVICWGYNHYGACGGRNLGFNCGGVSPAYGIGCNVSVMSTLQPMAIDVDPNVRPVQVMAHTWHTCLLSADGRIKCFGRNNMGQLGKDNTIDAVYSVGSDPPLTLVPETLFISFDPTYETVVVEIARGGNFLTCALFANGRARCWGDNSSGQCGYNSNELTFGSVATSPRAMSTLPFLSFSPSLNAMRVAALTAGFTHACALFETGAVVCWGGGGGWNFGQLGVFVNCIGGDVPCLPLHSAVPIVFSDTRDRVLEIACGEKHTCVLFSSGNVICFGDNEFLKTGSITEWAASALDPVRNAPSLTFASPHSAKGISAAENHSCVLRCNGSVVCFGRNHQGYLGILGTDPTTSLNSAPAVIFADATLAPAATCGPAPVVTVTFSGTTPDQTTVLWQEPFLNGFALLYYDVYLDGVLRVSNLSGATKTTIAGLLGDTEYSVRVDAVGALGRSQPGFPAVVRTPPPTVPGPCLAPVATALSPTSVMIEWGAPNRGGAVLLKFTVFRDNVAIAEAASNRFTDTGLSPLGTYLYSVAAWNHLGRGDPGPMTSVTTLQSFSAPGRAERPVIVEVGTSTVSLAWPTPFSGYLDLTCMVLRNGTHVGSSVNAVMKFTDNNLAPGATYVYSIECKNSLGSGGVGPAASVTLLYPSPFVSACAPPSGPAGSLVTLAGYYFGAEIGSPAIDVTFLAAPSLGGQGQGASWTLPPREVGTSRIVVAAPPGPFFAETRLEIFARSAHGTSLARQVTFLAVLDAAPRVAAVIPTSALAGATVTIAGENFGLTAPLNATLAGYPCAVVARSATAVQCTVSALGAGSGLALVEVAGSLAGETDPVRALFTYLQFSGDLSPIVSAVSPSSGPRSGGTVITIYGTRLGESAADLLRATVGLAPCARQELVSPTSVVCVTPPAESSTREALPVGIVTLAGGTSKGRAMFSYTELLPVILNANPKVVLAPLGGTVVTLRGRNFGMSKGAKIVAYIDGLACTSTTWVSETEVTCVAPPHDVTPPEERLLVSVTVDGRSSAGVDVGFAIAFRYSLTLCDPACGWNQECTLDARCLPCLPGWEGPLCLGRIAAVVRPADEPLVTSEDGIEASVEVVLLANVNAPLTLRWEWGAEEGSVSPSRIEFPAGTLAGARVRVAFLGSPDGVRDGNQPWTARLFAEPAEMPALFPREPLDTVSLLNWDSAPVIAQFMPRAVPMIGGVNATLTGRSWDPRIAVYLNGEPVVNFTRLSTAEPPWSSSDRAAVSRLASMASSQALSREKPLPSPGVLAAPSLRSSAATSSSDVTITTSSPSPYSSSSSSSKEPLACPSTASHFSASSEKSSSSVPSQEVSLADRGEPSHLAAPVAWTGPTVAAGGSTNLAAPLPAMRMDSIVFVAPMANITGYTNLTFVNILSGRSVATNSLVFYTDDCPREGYYGRGLECRECPEGAECPGGYRMWPLRGWWNDDEASGYVAPCIPAEACLGTRESLCAEGYVGVRCAQCAEGYGKVQQRCVSCDAGPETRWLIAVDLAVWLIVFSGLWLVRPVPVVGSIVGLVTCLQQLSSVGASADESFNAFVRRVFAILTLFSGDVTFLRPDCLGRFGFARNFFLQLGYLAALLGILLAGLGCIHAVTRFRLRGAANEAARRERTAFARARLRFSLVVYGSFVYYILTRRAVAALTCTRISGELVLLTAPDVVCFAGEHRGVAAIAIVILVVFTVGLPSLLAVKVWRALPLLLARDTAWISAWGFHQECVKPGARNQFLFLLTEVAMNLVLVLCDTVLITNSDARGSLLIAFPAALGIAVLALRPYRATMEYVICIVQWAASVMAGTLILVHSGSDKEVRVKFLVYTSVCLLLCAVLLFSVDVVLIAFRSRRDEEDRRKQLQNEGGKTQDGQQDGEEVEEVEREETGANDRSRAGHLLHVGSVHPAEISFQQSARSLPTLRELLEGTTQDEYYGYSYDDASDQEADGSTTNSKIQASSQT